MGGSVECILPVFTSIAGAQFNTNISLPLNLVEADWDLVAGIGSLYGNIFPGDSVSGVCVGGGWGRGHLFHQVRPYVMSASPEKYSIPQPPRLPPQLSKACCGKNITLL